jgi:hypothetical protein
LWIASLVGTKTVPDMSGVTAVQWAGAAITGGNWDESVVYDDAWHAPAPPQRRYVVVELPAGTTFQAVSGTVLK